MDFPTLIVYRIVKTSSTSDDASVLMSFIAICQSQGPIFYSNFTFNTSGIDNNVCFYLSRILNAELTYGVFIHCVNSTLKDLSTSSITASQGVQQKNKIHETNTVQRGCNT